MAITVRVPQYGCEHLSDKTNSQIVKFRTSHSNELSQGSAHYTCLQCSTVGNLITLDKHLAKTKHGFAVAPNSVYCGHCKDLVYALELPSKSKKRKLAEMSETEDAYLTSNVAQKTCGREGVRGLFNLGETCYMNAVLQMMIHNQLLSSYFLGSGHPIHACPVTRRAERRAESESEDEDDDDEQKACVCCAMNELFSDSKMVDVSNPAWAVNLLYASWKSIPDMAGRGQQDAQEWFMMIVDKLHESINPMADKKGHCHCFFHKVFFGRMRSEVTCDSCNFVSRVHEPYSSISLDFEKQAKKKKNSLAPAVKNAAPNVMECLKSYTTPENLPAEDYKCQACGVSSSTSKRLRIRKLPAILCVHVKRFGMKMVNGDYIEEKYGGKIDFPLVLNMSPYTTPSKPNSLQKFTYDLECVVVHQGEHSQNGHYFAFCKQDERWYRFDDEIVTATTTEDVMRQEAYLLFYSLRAIKKANGAAQMVNGTA